MAIQINHFQISFIVIKAKSGRTFHKSPKLFPPYVKRFSHSFYGYFDSAKPRPLGRDKNATQYQPCAPRPEFGSKASPGGGFRPGRVEGLISIRNNVFKKGELESHLQEEGY
jgi:hypothetical protein